MAGHRKSKPRRDRARADRMRARIAAAPDEYVALGHAFDWLRMELHNFKEAKPHHSNIAPHAAEASQVARQTLRELIARTEQVMERCDAE